MEMQYEFDTAYLLSPTETKHDGVGEGQNFICICPDEKWLGLNSILHRKGEKEVNVIWNMTFISKELVTLFTFLNYDFQVFYTSLWIIAIIIWI